MSNENETDRRTSLHDLAVHYVTDKISSIGHDYIPGYTDLFESKRTSVRTMIEIGIGLGAHHELMLVLHPDYRIGNCLKMWRDYFPCAHIYGLDIIECPPELSNESRITTFIADQSSVTDLSRVMSSIVDEQNTIDVIIDDGSHFLDHQVTSFMFLSKYLSTNGGIYVIEDVQAPHIESFQTLEVFPEDFREYIRDHFEVRWYDTRLNTGISDDFLMVFLRKS